MKYNDHTLFEFWTCLVEHNANMLAGIEERHMKIFFDISFVMATCYHVCTRTLNQFKNRNINKNIIIVLQSYFVSFVIIQFAGTQ